jgi:hypothetical protein
MAGLVPKRLVTAHEIINPEMQGVIAPTPRIMRSLQTLFPKHFLHVADFVFHLATDFLGCTSVP